MRRLGVFLVAAALSGLLVVSVAAGGKGGTDRPFKATFAGAATFTFPDNCSPSGCDEFTTHGDGTGQATHMGQVEVHTLHNLYDFDNLLDGKLTIVAANGDKLNGVYDYDLFSESDFIFVTIDGGTGRFAHASGGIELRAEVVPQFQGPRADSTTA